MTFYLPTSNGADVPQFESKIPLIIGEQLSAVIFIMDYLQFQFEDMILTVNNLPTVHHAGNFTTMGELGWRDAFCNLIAKIVLNVDFDAAKTLLTIGFAQGDRLEISLIPETTCPESIVFSAPNNHLEVW